MSRPSGKTSREIQSDANRDSPGTRRGPLHASSPLSDLEASQSGASVDPPAVQLQPTLRAPDSSEIDFDTGMKSFDKIIRRDAEAFRALAK